MSFFKKGKNVLYLFFLSNGCKGMRGIVYCRRSKFIFLFLRRYVNFLKSFKIMRILVNIF